MNIPAFNIRLTLLVTMLGLLATHNTQAQTLDNGDISRGTAVWRGDRAVQNDPADATNKVLAVELKKDKRQSFSQQVDTGGVPVLTFTFDVKTSADYKGDGITIRVTRPDGKYIFRGFNVEGAEWRKITCDYEPMGARRVTFAVEVKVGTGTLYFDNFTAKAKE